MSRQLVQFALALFLVSPFLLLFLIFKLDFSISMDEFLWALQNSVIQAFLSAFFSLVLGVLCAFGLFRIKNTTARSVAELFCLIPNFIPPLFTLISVFNFLDPFPMGVAGLVIVHTLINFGLVAVLISHQIENRVGNYAEVCWTLGTSRGKFLGKILFPLLRKDFLSISLFVFSVCFSSFSIPLVVGGGRGTTIEVLIYEKIRLSSDWGAAVLLSVIQSAILLGLSFLIGSQKILHQTKKTNLKLLESNFGLLILVCISCAYFLGYFEGVIEAISHLHFVYEVSDSLLNSFIGSFILASFVGLLTFLFLAFILWLRPEGWMDRFLIGYTAPSTALAAFAFLVFGPNEGFFSLLKIAFAFLILNINSMYRMGWQKSIQSLRAQREVALTLGASRSQQFFRLELPQLFQRLTFFSGLMAMWVAGDYGLSRILSYKDFTLALMAQTYLSSYRVSEATLISFFVLLTGSLVYFIFWGIGHVAYRKS